MPELRTHDGYPAVHNKDGSFSSELSITVEDERLNGGKPTNIPSLWARQVVSADEAIRRAVASGNRYPAFNSVDEAVKAAGERSKMKGEQMNPSKRESPGKQPKKGKAPRPTKRPSATTPLSKGY